jgi:uncharacterized protein
VVVELGLEVRHVRPIRQFVLKIHGRCDLACDYCYVYTLADQRWRSRPRAMSRATMRDTAARIAEHATTHGLRKVDVVLHGGEPLLAGKDDVEYCVTTLRAAAGDDVETAIALQTNGVRLDAEFLRLFARHGVRVGVSLDGDTAAHDRHRRHANGTGSHSQVTEAVRRLAGQPHRPLFGGLLCTIDLGNDPVRTYENLVAFDPPVVDFLLPHGNWSAPPPGRVPGSPATPYADWLIAVFDRWYHAPERETRVRLFAEIINLLFGGTSRVEGVGTAPSTVAVVETDGAIEGSDMLASAYEGAGATGLRVDRHSFDEALRAPVFVDAQAGAAGLAPACEPCAVRTVCGGGLQAHRYRRGTGFRNPSVYCPDLYHLIGHIRATLSGDLANLRRAT